MFEQSLFKIALRLLIAWLWLSALGFLFGQEIISPLLPFISWIVGLIEPGISPLVTVQQYQGNEMVHLSATTLQPLEISKSLVIPEGLRLTAAGSLVHALVPLVILWSPVIAWPVAALRERISLLLLSLSATLITVALTTPFLLTGRMEIMFSEMAFKGGEQREEPFVITWLLFTEGGGRWLIPITMAIGCIATTKSIPILRIESPVLRLGSAALALFLFSLYPVPGETARAPAPEQAIRALAQGVPQEFIVLFDGSAVSSMARLQREAGGHLQDTPAILARKAERYRKAKQTSLNTLPSSQWRTLRDFSHLPMAYLEVRTPLALERLRNRPDVIALLPNQRWDLALAESGPLISQPQTIALGQNGAGTTVAVLDTGVDYTHSAFGSCTAPDTPTGCRVVVAMDFATDDGELDASGHGTNVAGIVAGVAPGSQIAALDIFDGSSASSTDIIDAINWAISNRDTYNIVALNLSLSGHTEHSTTCDSYYSNPFRYPIVNARDAGILTITSAGNDAFSNGLPMPACTPEAVSVGAVYDSDLGSMSFGNCTDNPALTNEVTCFSNSASYLSLLAPGAVITAAGSSYSGTSQAAPHVSGLVALLKGAHPGESADQIESRLLASGTLVTDPKSGLTHPRIEAYDSITESTADLGISLTAAPDPIYVNQTLTYTLTTVNNGPATASNVMVSDQLPTAVSFISASAECAEAAGLVTCNLGNLTDGASTEIQILVTADSDGAITNTPSVSSDTQDLNSGNNSVSLATTVLPAADLSIAVSDSPDPVLQGETLTYAIEVDNIGPSTATGITVSYALPTAASFVAASPVCIETAGTVSCTLNDMTAGANTSIQIQVSADSTGNLDATVDVSGSEYDPVSSNNSAQTSTQVDPPGSGTPVQIPLPPWSLILLGIVLPLVGWNSFSRVTK